MGLLIGINRFTLIGLILLSTLLTGGEQTYAQSTCKGILLSRIGYHAPSEVNLEPYLKLRDELEIKLTKALSDEEKKNIRLTLIPELLPTLKWMYEKLEISPHEFIHKSSPITEAYIIETKVLLNKISAGPTFLKRDLDEVGFRVARILTFRKTNWENQSESSMRETRSVFKIGERYDGHLQYEEYGILEIPSLTATAKDINRATVEGITLLGTSDKIETFDGSPYQSPIIFRTHDKTHQGQISTTQIWKTPLQERRNLYKNYESFIAKKGQSDTLLGDLLEFLWSDAFFELKYYPATQNVGMNRDGIKIYLSETKKRRRYKEDLLGRLNNPIFYGGVVQHKNVTAEKLEEAFQALDEFSQIRN